MTARTYDSRLRRQRQAELQRRIAAAAATLHAQKGVRGTSYADIAAQANVSLPTVYARFPTQRALLEGCTAHVGATAPALPVDRLLASPDLRTAADALTDAIVQKHLHFEPWFAWREDRVIPFLADMRKREREALAALIGKLFERHLGTAATRRDVIAGWESLLSFDFWHRLARGHDLPHAAVKRLIVDALLAMAAQPATKHSRAKR
jgi:AcrR family transcriptional regulator